jgi:hypothetical protein
MTAVISDLIYIYIYAYMFIYKSWYENKQTKMTTMCISRQCCSVDQRIGGSAVGMAPGPHGGAEARREQREDPTTRALASCLCVETPVVAHRCFTLPPSTMITHPVRVHKYIPGRQANAV